MKAARCFVAIVAIGALAHEPAFAAEPLGNGTREKQMTRDRPASPAHDNSARMPGSGFQSHGNNRPAEKNSQAGSMNSPARHPSGSDLHLPASGKTAVSPERRLLPNKTATQHEQLARTPIGAGTAATLQNMLPARPVVGLTLGGAAALGSKTAAGVLNGSAMKRKP